jgi:spore germination cell wall hydrolase CwlJ-like protein
LGHPALSWWITLLVWSGFPFAAAVCLTAATYGQQMVAAVLLAEARGEGAQGMMAVAEVIRQRADSIGVSMLAVLEPGAFSCLNRTTKDSLLRRFQNHSLFPAALEIARLAYNEPQKLPGLTRGATHFTRKHEKPCWTVGHSPVVTIGNHAFYRLPG